MVAAMIVGTADQITADVVIGVTTRSLRMGLLLRVLASRRFFATTFPGG